MDRHLTSSKHLSNALVAGTRKDATFYSMSYFAGYSGLYRQPYANETIYGDTIYAITDDKRQELNLFLLTPGAYKDAFRIASCITYQRINIFVPSMDVLYISDVFRLVTDLLKIKKSVKWYYPEKITTTPTNVLFEMAQMTGNFYVSPVIGQLTIEFKLSNSKDAGHRFYDIYVCDDTDYIVFCMYMDAEKLTSLMTSSNDYDQVHLPYNSTFYGGLTCRECAALNPRWAPKLVANNFMCREEFIEAANSKYGLAKRIQL